jgi:hypothetical protein
LAPPENTLNPTIAHVDLKLQLNKDLEVQNQAVRRNLSRFPSDFMFQLDQLEFENWKSQFVTSNFSSRLEVPDWNIKIKYQP